MPYLLLISAIIMSLIPLQAPRMQVFAMQYLPHLMKVKSAPFHRSWYEELGNRDNQYLLIESGRGNAKSTIGSVMFALYNICESQDEDMQIASRAGGSTGTATKIMAKIKRELEENALLISDYGLKQGSVWGKEALEVVRGDGHRIMFYSVGKHSSIRGSRGTVLIDDPQNSADCRSETVLDADDDWLLTDVLPVIIHDQRLIIMATPISPLSLCAKVKRFPMFKILSFPAEDPVGSGKSAWPEQYSDEFLAERKAIMGLDRYAAEYLCQPRVSGNPVFRSEWLKSFEPESEAFQQLRNKGMFVVTAMDCAESQRAQADHTAIVTLAAEMAEKGRIYCIDVRFHHWTTKEGAEQIFQVFDKCQQNHTSVESRVAPTTTGPQDGDAMVNEIRERERIYSKFVNLYPVKQSRDKVTRAMYVQSIVQEGRLHLDMRDKNQQALIDEMVMFTGDQNYHDDLVDALTDALRVVKDQQLHSTGSVQVTSGLSGAWG